MGVHEEADFGKMKVYWLHLLLVCLSWMLLSVVAANNDVSRPAVINVGALLNLNSTIGKVANIAIREAVNDVNSNSTVLRGTKLNMIIRNSVCSGFLGFIQAMEFMETEVVAVIGPPSSVVAHIVSWVTTELHVPMLSFSATDPTLNSPFFVRTSNSDLYQMTAIADIVEYFGWREVIAIFIDDDCGRNGIAALDDALADRRSKVFYKAAISPDSDVTHAKVMDVLVNIAMMESRVVVLHVTPDVGQLVFSAASYLGMMGNGYAWISTDWLSSLLDSFSPLPTEIMSKMEGVLTLRQHSPNSVQKTAFISKWKTLTRGSSLGLNAYGLYAYDTVWILAHALDAFLSQGGNISFSADSTVSSLHATNLHLEAMHVFDGGQALMDNILRSDLVGLTGHLKFDSARSRVHPSYDIINVVGNGYQQVGYWSNYSGLSIVPPETLYNIPPNRSSTNQHLRNVFWPDGTTTKPRGWVFPNSGKRLKIGVPIRVSFKEFVSRVSGTNDSFKGFCIDVFEAAVNLLPYPVPYQFVGFGDGSQNPNYSDLVNMIAVGNIDAAVGDIAIVTSRTKIVDFTQPYASSGLVVVAPFKRKNTGAWAFLRPFTPAMWGVIVISFISIGVIIWVLEHRINDDFRGSPRRQCITILWFSFSTLTFSHRENTISCLARAVLIIWLFVVLILTSSYTASLTSILTVQQLSSPIKGIDSLRKSGEPIGYQVGSFAREYLMEELGIPESRLVGLNSPTEYADALRHGRVCGVVDERPYIELFLSSQCDFRIVGQEFTRSGWGFAFPRDSPLAPDLSTAILKLSENGDLQRIHDKWLTTSSCSQDNTEIESSQLHLKSFLGLFFLCGIACVVALAIFFTRICCRFHRVSATYVISDTGLCASLKRLQTLIYLIDEKKEPSRKRKKIQELTESPLDGDKEEECGRNPKRQQSPISKEGGSNSKQPEI